ncbi:hypothetical protein [Thermomonas fusca]|uniref:Uncharacterized protein n=1 Tax=Thermomonas fusca TaxID=215690 RepID=A0A5R9PEQ3_9GAMM|nr:hypothetical protein [Thermomonas fusca]TLX21872.1 hypothetical protein E5S66_04865 [Thermomonas fusca]
MKFWTRDRGERDLRAFGERFAWRMVVMFAGMALYLSVGSILDGRPTPLLAVLIALPLSYGFRLRAAADEQRRGQALEDERDAVIRAHADRAFRIAASCWYGVLALALVLDLDVGRAAVSSNGCVIPGLLLLGLIVANIAGHATVALLYRRDRT